MAEKNKRDRIITPEELSLLLAELKPHAGQIVLMGYHTGMRLGEILGLTWDRVNMKEGYIDLACEDTKTDEPRRVYFGQAVREVLIQANKVRSLEHNFVFTYRGKPNKSIKDSLSMPARELGSGTACSMT